MTSRVLLVDDHQIVRQGLRLLLERESDIEMVTEAGDGQTAINLVLASPPDLVVMDIGMPGLNGVEATRQIRAKNPQVQVIALSIHADKRFVAAMLQAGASGFLLKTEAARDLVEAIRTVMAGHKYLSPRLIDPLVDDYVEHLVDQGDPSLLTAREREVLQLIAEGKTTAQIANQLMVSEKTAATHRQHIMEKLNLHNVAELTKYAIKEGLTGLDE